VVGWLKRPLTSQGDSGLPRRFRPRSESTLDPVLDHDVVGSQRPQDGTLSITSGDDRRVLGRSPSRLVGVSAKQFA